MGVAILVWGGVDGLIDRIKIELDLLHDCLSSSLSSLLHYDSSDRGYVTNFDNLYQRSIHIDLAIL